MKHLIWFSVVLAVALSVMPAAPAKGGLPRWIFPARSRIP
jgi:hypothetical protein